MQSMEMGMTSYSSTESSFDKDAIKAAPSSSIHEVVEEARSVPRLTSGCGDPTIVCVTVLLSCSESDLGILTSFPSL